MKRCYQIDPVAKTIPDVDPIRLALIAPSPATSSNARATFSPRLNVPASGALLLDGFTARSSHLASYVYYICPTGSSTYSNLAPVSRSRRLYSHLHGRSAYWFNNLHSCGRQFLSQYHPHGFSLSLEFARLPLSLSLCAAAIIRFSSPTLKLST